MGITYQAMRVAGLGLGLRRDRAIIAIEITSAAANFWPERTTVGALSQPQAFDGLNEDAWLVLDQLARALHVKDARLGPTLDAIVSSAVDTVAPAQFAGLIIVDRGRLVPQACTGALVETLDEWQKLQGVGPCLEAAVSQDTVSVPDTRSEARWPDFADLAARSGVVSMLCVPLRVDSNCLGTLSLYAERSAAFSDHDLRVVSLYATHAALALADSQRSEQLREALSNRDLIGQAKGILMERHRILPDEAFRRLAEVSQRTNQKLWAVAQHLVDTGELVSTP